MRHFSEDISSYSLAGRYHNIFLQLVELGLLRYIFVFFFSPSKNEILLLFTLNISDTKKTELKQIVTQLLPQHEVLFALCTSAVDINWQICHFHARVSFLEHESSLTLCK